MHKNIFACAAFIAACGFFLRSLTPANAYMGPMVDYGANPIVSAAGTASSTSTTIFTAPADQDLLITDLIFSADATDHACNARIYMDLNNGVQLGAFTIAGDMDSDYGQDDAGSTSPVLTHRFASGLVIPASSSLQIYVNNCSSSNVKYTIAARKIRP